MSDSLISQFKRQYNAPIEEDRQVSDITTRDAISSSRRWPGMLVYVESEDLTYQLTGGIDNTSWEPLTGLSDAPEDGSTYGRKDGDWQILPTPETPDVSILNAFNSDVTTSGTSPNNLVTQTVSLPNIGSFIEFQFVLQFNGPNNSQVSYAINFGGPGVFLSGFPGGTGTLVTKINGTIHRINDTEYRISVMALNTLTTTGTIKAVNNDLTAGSNLGALNTFYLAVTDNSGLGVSLKSGYIKLNTL